MYKIRLLTTGDALKINTTLVWDLKYKIPNNVFDNIVFSETNATGNLWAFLAEPENKWSYLQFKTEDAARWFISHRLTYNPRRKDEDKLTFMKNLLEYNNVVGQHTVKHEFEIFEE